MPARASCRLFVLGGGSNLLVSDAGFPGLVVQAALEDGFQLDGNHKDGSRKEDRRAKTSLTYRVPAGLDWNAFVLMAAEAGISGIECLAGIPGLVGGSPIQNIGAYGQEVSTSIAKVHALDLDTLGFVSLPAEECHFAYRRSIFNTTHRNRYVVTAVTFQFDPNATPNLTYVDLQRYFAGRDTPPKPIDIYHAVREIRHRKGMLIVEGEPDCRSAGSFFKNPVVPESVRNDIAASLNIPAEEIPQWPAGDGSYQTARGMAPRTSRLLQRLHHGPGRNLIASHPCAHQSRPRDLRGNRCSSRHHSARSPPPLRHPAGAGTGASRRLIALAAARKLFHQTRSFLRQHGRHGPLQDYSSLCELDHFSAQLKCLADIVRYGEHRRLRISASQPRSSSINSSRNRRSCPVEWLIEQKEASCAHADGCGRGSCDHNASDVLRRRASTEVSPLEARNWNLVIDLFDDFCGACSIRLRPCAECDVFAYGFVREQRRALAGHSHAALYGR